METPRRIRGAPRSGGRLWEYSYCSSASWRNTRAEEPLRSLPDPRREALPVPRDQEHPDVGKLTEERHDVRRSAQPLLDMNQRLAQFKAVTIQAPRTGRR
jgi:hypothetical protein